MKITIDFSSGENILEIDEWSKFDINNLLKLIDNYNINYLRYDCSMEPIPGTNFTSDVYQQIIEKIKQKKITTDIVLPCLPDEYHRISSKLQLEQTVNHLSYLQNPYHFIIPTVKYCNKEHENVSKNNYFAILVGDPKEHRCRFIDYIHRYKLQESTFFTWNITQSEINIDIEYTFKHWEEKKTISKTSYSELKLEKRYIGQHSNLPEEYHKSVFDIVLETTTNCPFFSEKTWKPIYLQKPFLVYGSPNIHQKLSELGFLLYHFIDYRFDVETDDSKRAILLIEEMKKLINYPKEYLLQETKKINIYNYNRLMEVHKNYSPTKDVKTNDLLNIGENKFLI